MECIVEDVEDERETKGSPADCQRYEDRGGCDEMRIPISVQRSDGLSWCGQYQSHHCQAEKDSECWLDICIFSTDLIWRLTTMV